MFRPTLSRSFTRSRLTWAVLCLIASCTEPDAVIEPVGQFALASMNGNALPVKIPDSSDTLRSGDMLLRSDSIYAIYPRYRSPARGTYFTTIIGRWSRTGDSLTYRSTTGATIGHGKLSSGGVTFVQATDQSTFAFSPVTVEDSAILSERGSYSITVTGALSGTSTVSDTGHFLTGQGDYVFFNTSGIVYGGKQSSTFGPSDGRDLMTIVLLPGLTHPGTFTNLGCPSPNSLATQCLSLTYNVSQAPGNPNPRGSLHALPDDRVSIVVDALSFWHVKLSIAGPFEWWPPMPPGVAQQKDTVFVSASFNAFRVR
jgi:hypothetical protein